MPKVLPDISYGKSKITPFVDARNSSYTIPLYKDEAFFSNLESYTNFIRGCEKMVRTNDRYKKYIDYLKKTVKLDKCQVLEGITDQDADIEMHHGPVFTLFDYCCIVLEYFIIKGWQVSTLRIADAVLTEHEYNRIQIVMLSSTVHQEVHEREIFINFKHGYGDLAAFIKKYKCAMSDDLKDKLNRYIDRSMISDSNDFGILKVNTQLYSK